MAVWTDPAWLDEAHAWIDRELRRLDLVATGAIAQPHVRPWATALRVPVADGDLWFKATIPLHTYEAGATAILGRRFPQRIPELCAVDLERGWLLMRDAGAPLRDVLARERDLARWLEVLPLYAELQIDATGDRDELLAAGVPDRRLTGLHSRYERLLDEVRGLTGDEQVLLRSLQPRVREMCEELAAYAIPETIQHNDFHDGQVFLQQGGYVFSDWGESCVSHPLFTMAVTLEGNIAWGLDDIEGSVELAPFRDAYLEPFSRYATGSELRSALAIALRLGWICRAVDVQRWASALEPPDREKHLDGVAIRLRMFLSGLG